MPCSDETMPKESEEPTVMAARAERAASAAVGERSARERAWRHCEEECDKSGSTKRKSRNQHVEERGVVDQARKCVDQSEGEERVAVGGQRREHEEHDKAMAAKNPADIVSHKRVGVRQQKYDRVACFPCPSLVTFFTEGIDAPR